MVWVNFTVTFTDIIILYIGPVGQCRDRLYCKCPRTKIDTYINQFYNDIPKINLKLMCTTDLSFKSNIFNFVLQFKCKIYTAVKMLMFEKWNNILIAAQFHLVIDIGI